MYKIQQYCTLFACQCEFHLQCI